MSRCSAYQGMSRSRKQTLCPRALSARTSARNVVACPLPHEEVMDKPKITMSSGLVISNYTDDSTPPFNFVFEETLQLLRTMFICVLSQHSLPCGFTHPSRLVLVQRY